MRVRSLGWEDALEEGTATHSSILAWRIPWTEGPDGLQPTGWPRVRHDGFPSGSSVCFSLGFSSCGILYPVASRCWERDLCGFGCNRARKAELGLGGSGSGNMNSSFLQIQEFPSIGAITTNRSKQNSSSQLLLLTGDPNSLS